MKPNHIKKGDTVVSKNDGGNYKVYGFRDGTTLMAQLILPDTTLHPLVGEYHVGNFVKANPESEFETFRSKIREAIEGSNPISLNLVYPDLSPIATQLLFHPYIYATDAIGKEYVWGYLPDSKKFQNVELPLISGVEVLNYLFSVQWDAYLLESTADHRHATLKGSQSERFSGSDPMIRQEMTYGDNYIPRRKISIVPNRIVFWNHRVLEDNMVVDHMAKSCDLTHGEFTNLETFLSKGPQ